MASPPPKSSVPATVPTVWPPSNPSGTVIPFPLPWGQTGCCPPGGMDALMKCYCDIQQASAFIGQIMLDQIANNPAIIQAIIAGIEASGSNLPLIGRTDGLPVPAGQVGEIVQFAATGVAYGAAAQTQTLTLGVQQPGNWDGWAFFIPGGAMTGCYFSLSPVPAGFDGSFAGYLDVIGPQTGAFVLGLTETINISVPSLVAFSLITNLNGSGTAGTGNFYWTARRRA